MARTEIVVLLHGLGRTHLSLAIPRLRLRQAGFVPLPVGYPSLTRSIEESARIVRERLPKGEAARIHFLTHSLGGLIARYLLRVARPANLGRVVMLSPPNQGSRMARRFGAGRVYPSVLGPSGRQLASDPGALAELLGPVDFELGIITGDRPLLSTLRVFDEPNDGKVTVREARLDGAADFLVVPRGHTFIMNARSVIDQAIHFLRHGRFARFGGR